MGRICDVYYEEICDMNKDIAAEFYFLFNMLNKNSQFDEEYEEHEERLLNIRNAIIGRAYENALIPHHPKMNTTIMGISSLTNNLVLITEY